MAQSEARAWWADVQHLRDGYERTDEARRRADEADLAARRATRERRGVEAEVSSMLSGPRRSPAAPRRVSGPEPAPRRVPEPDSAPDFASRTDPAPRSASRPDRAPRSASRPDRAPRSASRPDPASHLASRPDPASHLASRPDPASHLASRPDSAPRSASRPDPAPRSASGPDPASQVASRTDPAPRLAPQPDLAPRRGAHADGRFAGEPSSGPRVKGSATPGRRTVEIRGRTVPAPMVPRPIASDRRRPPRRAIERVGARPDRVAMWALLMGLMLILVAIGTADTPAFVALTLR